MAAPAPPPRINSAHLIEQAELLRDSRQTGGLLRQANRRRAISTAYYAVFHFLLTAVADEFVGKGGRRSSRYALVYRSIDHNDVKTLCEIARKDEIRADSKYFKYVPEDGFGPSIKEFATLTLELREKRHEADYDPSYWAKLADVNAAIEAARTAIEKFPRAGTKRRKAFLSLLLFKPRG
jgi:uncharacterized protein (UPF0332 family)